MTSQTLKSLGWLMMYPQEELLAAGDELRMALRSEGWLSEKTLKKLDELIISIQQQDVMDLQEDYVVLFDRTPSLSLHLFEHVHGDSRGRGQALVDLDNLYREMGLFNVSEHTPDFLPLFLEYLSLLPAEKAQENLNGAINVIGALGARLTQRQSRYAIIFEALAEAARSKPDEKKLKAALAADAGDLPDNDTMDAAWEEQFALAPPQPGRDGCSKTANIRAQVERMKNKTKDKAGAAA